jgi:hypothetical protein
MNRFIEEILDGSRFLGRKPCSVSESTYELW